MKATDNFGALNPIPNCDIVIPTNNGPYLIPLRILPEISDTKSADYQDQNVIGRAVPIKSFAHGGNRSISMKVTFVILRDEDALTNLKHIRAIQSAVYPRQTDNSPYLPPPICKIRCGSLLAGSNNNSGYLCVVLKSYSVDYPTDIAWYSFRDSNLYVPYKVTMGLNWETVYDNESLPGQTRILGDV